MQSKAIPVYVMPSAAQLQMAFNAFDSDKGGKISSKELQQILSRCGVIAEIAHCDALVGLYSKTNEMDLPGFSMMIGELFDLVSTSTENQSLKKSHTVKL